MENVILIFSAFTAYSYKRADHKMEEVIETVEKHEMPLNSYTWIHKRSQINERRKNHIEELGATGKRPDQGRTVLSDQVLLK